MNKLTVAGSRGWSLMQGGAVRNYDRINARPRKRSRASGIVGGGLAGPGGRGHSRQLGPHAGAPSSL